jgi:hypothetical protein
MTERLLKSVKFLAAFAFEQKEGINNFFENEKMEYADALLDALINRLSEQVKLLDLNVPTKVILISCGVMAISDLVTVLILLHLGVDISEVHFVDKQLASEDAQSNLYDVHANLLPACDVNYYELLKKYRFGSENEDVADISGQTFYVGFHVPFLSCFAKNYKKFEDFLLSTAGVRLYISTLTVEGF